MNAVNSLQKKTDSLKVSSLDRDHAAQMSSDGSTLNKSQTVPEIPQYRGAEELDSGFGGVHMVQ